MDIMQIINNIVKVLKLFALINIDFVMVDIDNFKEGININVLEKNIELKDITIGSAYKIQRISIKAPDEIIVIKTSRRLLKVY